jgi:hypothetical protein
MQINTLLQPLEPPPGGLQQLQQKLIQSENTEQKNTEPQNRRRWRQASWQTALMLSFFAIGWQLLTPDVKDAPVLVQFHTKTTAKPSTVVALPAKDSQVKMYWQFEQS